MGGFEEDESNLYTGQEGGPKGLDQSIDDLKEQQDKDDFEYYQRQQKKRKDKRSEQKKQELSEEDRRQQLRHQKAELKRFKNDLKQADTEDELNRIVLSNYDIPQKDSTPLKRELDAKKRKVKEKAYNKQDKHKVESAKKATSVALGAIPFIGGFLAAGASTAIGIGNKAKNKAKSWRDVRQEGKDRANGKFKGKASRFLMGIGFGSVFVGTFLMIAVLIFLVSTWTLVAILLSHPESIKELYANNVLGDALWMGNVTEDVTVDGEVIVKGRFDASPGCFIYNGIWYCGNCLVLQDGESTEQPTKCDINYDTAGQGEFGGGTETWAKNFEATFIGDSLGVGVESTLSQYFSKMNFDVKGSRWLIYNGDEDSTDPLNGIHILKELAKDDQVKDTLVVALGTNGGIKEGDLETFMKEVPSNVKRTIFVNTASEGGVDSDAIDKAIKDFVKSSSLNVGYLDWKKYAESYGRDKIYGGDDIHMTGAGYKLYGMFITQGLYDIFNTVCSVGDLGDHNISGNIDDSSLRSGVSVNEGGLSGLQDWPKRIMNVGSNLFLDVNTISAYRAGDSQDHGKGLAVDFMVPEGSHESTDDLGDVIAQWVVDNMEALNVNYVIWEQRIYGSWNKEWQAMENRGSVTQNHFDHPHLSFNGGSGDLSKVKPPTKANIELPSTIEARGDAPSDVEEELDDLLDHTHGIPKADIDTTQLGDVDIETKSDLTGMTDEEYRLYQEQERLINRDIQYIVDNQLIKARGDSIQQNRITSPQPFDSSGWESQVDNLYNFNVRSKEPDWVDVDFLKELFNEYYPDSRIKGHEQELLDLSDQYGINVAVMLGQFYLETSMGRVGCPAGAPHNPASYESPYNFGCVMWPGTMGAGAGRKQSDFESNWMVDLGVNMNERGYVANRYWADPETPALGMELGFRVYDNLATDTNTYKEVLDLYSPIGDGGQTHEKFMRAMYGVLQQFGIDITKDYGEKIPGGGTRRSSNNIDDSQAFHCPDNCVITEEEKELGTGNVKPLPKGQTWENDDSIINTDLGYMSDTVTPENLDKYIDANAPNDSDFIGMGDVFYEAGVKSGYDPRYVLAHAIHETGWGTSQIWRDKNNAYGWMAYDDSAYASSKDFDTPEEGIIQGAQLIYKNYYVDYQQTSLYLMQNDPTGGGHNYATDPNWGTKIAAYMKAMESYMGPSQGGSVGQQSNNYARSSNTNSTGQERIMMTNQVDLGRGCSLGDVTFDNLPMIAEDTIISSFYHDANYPYGLHGGADLTYADGGEGPIFSVADGEVVDAYTSCSVGQRSCGGGWGNYIKIRHTGVGDGSWETLYAHLKEGTIRLKVGDKVSAGQEIATMGTTGRSDGVHLHFELWHDGQKVDNYPYFSWKDATYSPGWENYAGPFSGEPCTPGASNRGRQGSSTRSEGCAVDKPISDGLRGNSNAEKVYHFFSDYGFSDAAIAGILGNLMLESGLNAKMIQGAGDRAPGMTYDELDELLERSIYVWSDPSIPSEGIGPAVGISQWEHNAHYGGSMNPGRWEGVMAWSKKNGYSHWDLEAQLNYIIREFGIVEDPDVPLEYGVTLINEGKWACNSDEGCQVGIKGFDNFMKTDDVVAATKTYFQFNRAGTAAMSKRIQYAKEFYAEMANWK